MLLKKRSGGSEGALFGFLSNSAFPGFSRRTIQVAQGTEFEGTRRCAGCAWDAMSTSSGSQTIQLEYTWYHIH